MTIVPWEVDPNLEKKRIIEVAKLILDVRADVIDLHNEDLGDTPKSLGTRAYECCRTKINLAAKNNDPSWLSVLTPDGRFTFQIGKTPVRFVRNDPENLPSKKLVLSEETLIQMELFKDDVSDSSIRWFFVIDTYVKHVADNMYFVGYDDTGAIVCKWEVPIEEREIQLLDINLHNEKAVEIEKAPITIKPMKQDNVLSNGK